MKELFQFRKNKNILIVALIVVTFMASIMFFYSFKYRHIINIEHYGHIEGTLTDFTCKISNKGQYNNYIINNQNYWSYFNNGKENNCEASYNLFEPILNKNIEIWVDHLEIVQISTGDNTLIDIKEYVSKHKSRALRNGIFLLFYQYLH